MFRICRENILALLLNSFISCKEMLKFSLLILRVKFQVCEARLCVALPHLMPTENRWAALAPQLSFPPRQCQQRRWGSTDSVLAQGFMHTHLYTPVHLYVPAHTQSTEE